MINKIDRLLAQLTKERTTQMNRIRNKHGDILTDTSGIQNILREYRENLYSIKLENLKEMDKFLGLAKPQN